jgi:prolyl-tRNA editing enzyme YbaK/EbsC (Cys-tRNA(Pro) deacylase)
MDGILEKAAVKRFKEAADSLGVKGDINILADTARTAIDAANGLGIEVGQIASSLIFKLPSGNPLLIITSGRHRVDTELVAKKLNIPELGRADANYVKEVSGYSVGGVPPLGFVSIFTKQFRRLISLRNLFTYLGKLTPTPFGGV